MTNNQHNANNQLFEIAENMEEEEIKEESGELQIP